MKQKLSNQKKQESSCYYSSYAVCTCNQSANCDKPCVGSGECEQFISENEYFSRVMDGSIKEKDVTSGSKTTSPKTYENLMMGKSKKALKREAKIEAEKNQEGSGFSIKDDPRFADLFGKK